MSIKNLTKTFENFDKTMELGVLLVNDLVDAMNRAVSSEFSVGQRIQFYRKDAEDNTLAINGTITRICPKTGWLTVEHKWGWATVKPDKEKLQVLQQKAAKKAALASAYGEDAVVVSGSGDGPNPQNVAKV